VPIDPAWDFAVSRASLGAEIPGAVWWPERHVTALAVIGTLLVIGAGSIVMTLLQGPNR